MTRHKGDPPDPSDNIKSRCPACLKWVVEGTKHLCPAGRSRDPFINPMEEK